ncbi:uncharacterized protein LOC113273259 [Papaver somniferum]|uniref:uncharacterized protein LOC113273259 n=1 Tax=Papaver somniferum TaxID=3469 RepID=UPI000E6FCAFA|nr:uncharacterized protein LOC113273259 [Papaver somniferum]
MDDEVKVRKGYDMVSRCCICGKAQDNMHHLLWKCDFSVGIWKWIFSCFQFDKPKNFTDAWRKAKNKSPLIQRIIAKFKLEVRNSKFQMIKECYWLPPDLNFTMVFRDGSSFGNPGNVDFWVIVRDHDCQVLDTLTGGIGIASNFIAELYAVICALELEIEWGKQKVIIVSDSKSVVNVFNQKEVPWFIRGRWKKVVRKLSIIKYLHCYREVNFSADGIAKKGASLAAGERHICIGRPSSLISVEMPDVKYYRFS